MAHPTLLFIRHAETALAGTFCGSSDPPLNDKGRARLPALCAHVLRETTEVSAVYTSHSQRAVATAEFLAEQLSHGALPVHVRPALREIDFGQWETLTWEAIEQRDPAYAARWVAEFPQLPAPGGEPIPSFKQRVLEEIHFLRAQAERESIAVVTHAGVLRVLLEELGHFAPHHAWERTREYGCLIRCVQHSPTGIFVVD